MEITGIEALWLLYAIRYYCAVDKQGKVTIAPCATLEEWQDLRDRLFAVHEHPEED